MAEFNPAKTGLSRVWLIDGGARGDRAPEYMNAMRAGSLSQSFGDVTPIKIPSDTRFSQYDEVDEIQGAEDRPTISLEGRYARDLKSRLLLLARKRCEYDVQVHIGDCTDPRVFNDFKKIVIMENARSTNYGTDDLGSLTDDDENPVNENTDVSGARVYEVLPMNFAEKAGTTITTEVVDVWICDTQSCGDCEELSDGCQTIMAITKAAGGSPSTPADIIYTKDKWVTYFAHDIETLGVAEDPSAGDCVGDYVVVISNTSNSMHIALISEFDEVSDPDFTEVTVGFVAGGEPNAIKSIGSKAFIVGDGGYIYVTGDPAAGVTVLDAGEAVTETLYAVDAISETFAVAVGQDGAVVKTENGTTWEEMTVRPVGVGVNLLTVAVKSKTEWMVGTSGGALYITYNGGATWNLKAFPGSGAGSVRDIKIATNSVIFMAHDTIHIALGSRGRILASYDGGYSWVVLPKGTASMPASDHINAIAPCKFDPNSITGGGLGDNSTDGFLVYGAAAE